MVRLTACFRLRPSLPTRGREAPHDAAIFTFELRQPRERGGHAQQFGITRMNAGDDGIGEHIRNLLPGTPPGKSSHRLVIRQVCWTLAILLQK